MMYPFMTLNDDTEITHLEMRADGRVKVYIETPHEKRWISQCDMLFARLQVGEYKMVIQDMEMSFFKKLIRENAHLIMEFSQEGRNSECRKFFEDGPYIVYFGRMKMSCWNRCMSILQREEQLQMRQSVELTSTGKALLSHNSSKYQPKF